MTFGEKVKEARLALNMSQTELSQITGISERSLYTYEQLGTMINTLPYALSTLSPVRREAIRLKYFKYPNKSDAEIATLLFINAEAFEDRRRQAIKDLKNFYHGIR